MKVTNRQIAKILVRALPLADEEIAGKTEEYIRAIEAMPENARLALQSAYILSSKVPKEEREKVIERIEAQRIYRELPRHIKLLVKKRHRGEPLLPKERLILFNHRQELRSSNPDYQYRAVGRK